MANKCGCTGWVQNGPNDYTRCKCSCKGCKNSMRCENEITSRQYCAACK